MATSRRTRREFVKSAVAAAAVAGSACARAPVGRPAAAPRVIGANERIRIGVIGCGSRGRDALMQQVIRYADEENVEIIAVCDPWLQMREQANAMVKEKWGRDAQQFIHYKDLLALEDLDAVMIACPDHQHATVLRDAARVGKDAYCEKPWAMSIEELNEAVDAVRKANRIVQAGTQLRSYPSFTGCRKLVQSGALGFVIKCEQVRNNTAPYWHSYANRPVKPEDADWKAFLMHKRFRPWDPDQFAGWYGYSDFSSGPIGGYMSHFVDLVHYVTGQTLPWRAVSLGGKKVYKDPRTCPEVIQTILEYPNGMLVSYATTMGNSAGSYMHFLGTRGMIDATDWDKPTVTGKGAMGPDPIPDGEVEPVEVPQHMQDWLQCLRSRKQPNANVDAGYSHAVACILSDVAYVEGRRMVYDAKKRTIYQG